VGIQLTKRGGVWNHCGAAMSPRTRPLSNHPSIISVLANARVRHKSEVLVAKNVKRRLIFLQKAASSGDDL